MGRIERGPESWHFDAKMSPEDFDFNWEIASLRLAEVARRKCWSVQNRIARLAPSHRKKDCAPQKISYHFSVITRSLDRGIGAHSIIFALSLKISSKLS